jgi:hypothetical protein
MRKQETEQTMGFVDNLIAWCKDEIQHMKKQMEWMESGRVQLRTMSPDTGWINTTANDIERYKRKIAEMDALIVRPPEVK